VTPVAPLISAFLQEFLPEQREASIHTRDTYAYSFQLLFLFASKRLKVRPSDLNIEQIDAPMVNAFLEHLETQRGNKASTRNTRLAAIKSFFHFLEYRLPALLEQIRSVLAIPLKKTDSKLVPFLDIDETKALLDAPKFSTPTEIRDRALLHLALTAGLRASELIGLREDDLTLQPTTTILVRGKGRKERLLPLSKQTAAALRAWLGIRRNAAVPELFVNARGQPLSRWGIAHILKKHLHTASQRSPSLLQKRVSPHVLRHSCAMMILKATHDIRKVSLWLGHSSIQTTEIYTRVDPTDKLEVLHAVVPPNLRKGRFHPPDKLIALLKPSSLWGVKTPGRTATNTRSDTGLPINNRSP
jgi:site-specific recombinase XerD